MTRRFGDRIWQRGRDILPAFWFAGCFDAAWAQAPTGPGHNTMNLLRAADYLKVSLETLDQPH